jgi:hypothetical protein
VIAMAEQAAAEMNKQRDGRSAGGAGGRGADDEIEMRSEGAQVGIPVRSRIGDRYAL